MILKRCINEPKQETTTVDQKTILEERGRSMVWSSSCNLGQNLLRPHFLLVETHYKNTCFFALTLTKMLTVAN